MPNWCSNYVTLTAPDDKTLDEFMDHMKFYWNWEAKTDSSDNSEPPGFCGYFVPEPDYDTVEVPQSHPELSKGSNFRMPSWWDFRVTNWGTKWEIDCNEDYISIEEDTPTVSFTFDSAWSPPIAIYEAATEKGWKVEANFCETGCCFIGYYSSDEGEHSFDLTTRRDSKVPEWLMELYDYEFDLLEECERENDCDELKTREEFVKKHGDDYGYLWDNTHNQETPS